MSGSRVFDRAVSGAMGFYYVISGAVLFFGRMSSGTASLRSARSTNITCVTRGTVCFHWESPC